MHPGRPDEEPSRIDDELLLISLPGAVDYLVADLHELEGASVVQRWADAVRIRYAGPVAPLAAIRYYSACAVWLGEAPDAEAAGQTRLRESAASGLVGRCAQDGPLTFRVADVGEHRWALRDRLVETHGWVNAPGDWQLNLDLYRGWLVAEVGALHQTRRFGELARMPASTTPVVSAVLVRLAKASAGDVVLDPCCGAGTNLVTLGESVPGARLVGLDVDPRALVAAATNLAARRVPGVLARSDLAHLPMGDDAVDRVVANLPFGKRVGSHGGNVTLYPAFVREVGRVLTAKGRAVLLTEEKRLLLDAVQRTRGVRIIKEIELATGGLHPSAYVVVRGRSTGRGRRV